MHGEILNCFTLPTVYSFPTFGSHGGEAENEKEKDAVEDRKRGECNKRSGGVLKAVGMLSFSCVFCLPLLSPSLKQRENIQCWRGETKDKTSHIHTHIQAQLYFKYEHKDMYGTVNADTSSSVSHCCT